MHAREAQLHLTEIRKNFEENKLNNYHLSESEISDTRLVLNTLDFVVTALIHNTPLPCQLYFYNDKDTKIVIPIHFENYALNENKNENDLLSVQARQLVLSS